MSGLVRARGLKLASTTSQIASSVRARKSPRIETEIADQLGVLYQSGLVRARGLK